MHFNSKTAWFKLLTQILCIGAWTGKTQMGLSVLWRQLQFSTCQCHWMWVLTVGCLELQPMWLSPWRSLSTSLTSPLSQSTEKMRIPLSTPSAKARCSRLSNRLTQPTLQIASIGAFLGYLTRGTSSFTHVSFLARDTYQITRAIGFNFFTNFCSFLLLFLKLLGSLYNLSHCYLVSFCNFLSTSWHFNLL